MCDGSHYCPAECRTVPAARSGGDGKWVCYRSRGVPSLRRWGVERLPAAVGVLYLVLVVGCAPGEPVPETPDASPASSDVVACEHAGEALAALETLPEAPSRAASKQAESRADAATRLVGLSASEASNSTIRDAGIEASRVWRTGDVETAFLHLRSVAAACREVGIVVDVVSAPQTDPLLSPEGQVCLTVEELSPDLDEEQLYGQTYRSMEEVLEREREFLSAPLDDLDSRSRQVRRFSRSGTWADNWMELQDACRSWFSINRPG